MALSKAVKSARTNFSRGPHEKLTLPYELPPLWCARPWRSQRGPYQGRARLNANQCSLISAESSSDVRNIVHLSTGLSPSAPAYVAMRSRWPAACNTAFSRVLRKNATNRYLQDLQISFKNYLGGKRSHRDIDHSQIETKVGEKSGHGWVPAISSITRRYV